MVPTPPPEDEGEPEGDIVGRGGPDRVPVTLTLRLPPTDLLAVPHAVGVLEVVPDLDGVDVVLGQRDSATVRLAVEEIRAVPERRRDAVALADAEGVFDVDAEWEGEGVVLGVFVSAPATAVNLIEQPAPASHAALQRATT